MTTALPTFATFWRCALQVNPASYHGAYRGQDHGLDESAYNQALLAQCQALGVRVVGVADHGSVARVDALRQVLAAQGIVVFPGFEVAANDKAHFVCLFAEDTSAQQLERYLGCLRLLGPQDGVGPSALSSQQLIDEVVGLGGFVYAAHCTSDSGLLKLRQHHVWQNPKLRAAQIPGSVDDLTGVEDDFYRKAILNKLPAYQREHPMAVINAKDVARPEDLAHPSASCWVKMTRPTFAAFKQAFLDPASRVRLQSEQPAVKPSALHVLRISGGYLDGVEARLSGHLDTVVGGRGTGKSTLIECLRFALDVPPKGRQALNQHLAIVKENLTGARVEVELSAFAQHGRRYLVSRRHGEAPIVSDAQGQVSILLPRDLLPQIDIYGQNEIYELAQDDRDHLRLLERFLPSQARDTQALDAVRRRLQDNATQLTQALQDADALQAQLQQLPKLQEQLSSYDALGLQEKLAQVPLLERERQLETRVQEDLARVKEAVNTLEEALPDPAFLSDKALETLPNAAALRGLREVLAGLRTGMAALAAQAQALVQAHDTQLATARSTWVNAQASVQAQIDQALRSVPAAAGRTGAQIGAEYQRLQHSIERIRPLATRADTYAQLLGTLQQERRNLLAELSDLGHARQHALEQAIKRLNRQLEGRLRLKLLPQGDRAALKTFLLDCKLEGVGEKRLAWVDDLPELSPAMLDQAIEAGIGTLRVDWGLTDLVANALTQLPPSKRLALQALELAHKVVIELNVAHDDAPAVFRPLHKLSTGQQCTALLHLLLLDNRDPLVMDQPEDNLDNAFIAERIVRELRQAKTQRQFLFATHNANIPVFGDAEWIGVFSATEAQASLAPEAQGSIDVPQIRDAVANLLEGGKAAFMQRKAKYEF